MAEYIVTDNDMRRVANKLREVSNTSMALRFPDEWEEVIDDIVNPSLIDTDITFYDYDGVVVARYTIEQAQALFELPIPLEHNGLTFQGWNYTLEQVNTFTRKMNVGACYITDDGKTRIYMSLDDIDHKKFRLGFRLDSNSSIIINWGDNTDTVQLQNTTEYQTTEYIEHEYSVIGDYIVSIEIIGTVLLERIFDDTSDELDTVTRATVRRVEFGAGITAITDNLFENCVSLTDVSLSSYIESIGQYAFKNCTSLRVVILPSSCSISSGTYYNCISLNLVILTPNNYILGSYVFYDCNSLVNIILPDPVKPIDLPDAMYQPYIGSYAFYNCAALKEMTIPNGYLSLQDYVFGVCSSLETVIISDTVQTYGEYVFQWCTSLKYVKYNRNIPFGKGMFFACTSLEYVIIPSTSTSLDATFAQCSSLKTITIPDTVEILSGVFRFCTSLSILRIPSSVNMVLDETFAGCSAMTFYDFSGHNSIPTLGNNVFRDIPTGTEIRVPMALYDSWIVATNWIDYADNIVAV